MDIYLTYTYTQKKLCIDTFTLYQIFECDIGIEERFSAPETVNYLKIFSRQYVYSGLL